ncbi:hypothetical protein KVV02_005257 [Mortierella alpina]|uniref:Peptidase S9 prolyl oligopeptidase catalytic domain-containing protein n=1 Tax=Mortierella alpina TaxID=64518 RepID=A0A9P8A278_MORAP|nr:hypothetical protein KVV02_005257 [Mortierella alpina]
MAQQGSDDDGLYAVAIQCENVGDFYVDDERLSGDWYGYGLTRHTLRLAPGSKHTLSVRVVHEVRIFGGVILPPPSKFRCELAVPSFPIKEDQEKDSQDIDGDCSSHSRALMVQVVKEGYGGYVAMDAVENILAGKYISVALRNVGPRSVLVKSVRVVKGSELLSASLTNPGEPISLYPSVHRPIAIRLEGVPGAAVKFMDRNTKELAFTLAFELQSGADIDRHNQRVVTGTLRTCTLVIAQRKWGEPYKYTFLDFDGTVQYAAAIPPSHPTSNPLDSAPVLVSLHGAGVEVDQSPFWLSEYTQRERTWIVLPTGRSPWGYDWHGASMQNVASAIESLANGLYGIPEHLKGLPGMRPDPERLLIAGHSNGGQGAWFMVTHFPDKAIAATPAAGYVNIKQYVPFTGWLSNSYTDSHLRGLLEASIIEFDNDVHMSNTVGIPILARTGGADDNVPPLNSRKLVRLGQENAHNLSAISLSEIPGAGHWFEGVLHDNVMQAFLNQHLHDNTIAHSEDQEDRATAVTHPRFPLEFEITVLNPAGIGSRGGIQVEQLRLPYRQVKGTVKVKIVKDEQRERNYEQWNTWIVETTNVRRLRFLDSPSLRLRRGQVSTLILDGVRFDIGQNDGAFSLATLSLGSFLREGTNKGPRWQFMSSSEWIKTERHRETYGPAIQILEKKVVVVVGTHFNNSQTEGAGGQGKSPFARAFDRIAKLVSHDIYLYGRGDAEIITDKEYLARIENALPDTEVERPNLVLIGDHHQNSVTKLVLAQTEQKVAINSQEGLVVVQPGSDPVVETEYRQPGTGLLMIRPWGTHNLAMVIAGLDVQGVETAARLFPKRTGLLVPDWVVTGPEMAWKGAGGILAAGYWGNRWEYLPHMSA